MSRFPRSMIPSTLEERASYYEREFNVRAVSNWIKNRRGIKFALIPGRHTGLVPASHAADRDNVVIIDEWDSASDLRDYALDYLPEGLYYDRNRYLDVRQCRRCGNKKKACFGCYNFDGQQLAFDLDPENVDCPYHGHIGDKMSRGEGLSFCMYEFKAVRRQALELSWLMREEYESVEVVYSGRGFHVVIEDETAYALTRKERVSLAARLGRRFAIDEWVTSGGSRLLRLPHSLNGIVSRKCIKIKLERDLVRFDPRDSSLVVPRFRRSA